MKNLCRLIMKNKKQIHQIPTRFFCSKSLEQKEVQFKSLMELNNTKLKEVTEQIGKGDYRNSQLSIEQVMDNLQDFKDTQPYQTIAIRASYLSKKVLNFVKAEQYLKNALDYQKDNNIQEFENLRKNYVRLLMESNIVECEKQLLEIIENDDNMLLKNKFFQNQSLAITYNLLGNSPHAIKYINISSEMLDQSNTQEIFAFKQNWSRILYYEFYEQIVFMSQNKDDKEKIEKAKKSYNQSNQKQLNNLICELTSNLMDVEPNRDIDIVEFLKDKRNLEHLEKITPSENALYFYTLLIDMARLNNHYMPALVYGQNMFLIAKQLDNRSFISRSLLYIADFTIKTKEDQKSAMQQLDQLLLLEKGKVNFKVLNSLEMMNWIATNKMDPEGQDSIELKKTTRNAADELIKVLPFWWERKDQFIYKEMGLIGYTMV